MSQVQRLLQQLCPDGVEFVKLGSCLDYEQPGKYIISSKDYIQEGTPVLTAGQTFILGYTDETDGIYQASEDNPVIIFDDFTTSFHWVTFPFKVKSSAMKMLRPSRADISFRFVYYAMKCIKYETLEHARQWISKYSNIEIPLPPLPIQNKIVNILDKFTTLEAELEAELDCRKRQYQFYRDKLLSFQPNSEGTQQVEWKNINPLHQMLDKLCPNGVEFVKLGEVCTIKNGKDYKHLTEGDVPVYGSGGIMTYVNEYAYDKPSVLLPRKGSLNNVFYVDTPFWTVDTIFWTVTDEELLLPKFFFYLMSAKDIAKMNITNGGAVPSMTQKLYCKIMIPIPPLVVQEEIIRILDRFERLTTDLQDGLPAEIQARRQQYEYYRNKLLTFKRKTA